MFLGGIGIALPKRKPVCYRLQLLCKAAAIATVYERCPLNKCYTKYLRIFSSKKGYCMKNQDTIEKVEEFTDKYIYKLPNVTVVEYIVLAIVCFYIVRRLS
jgi:hypothetical protein